MNSSRKRLLVAAALLLPLLALLLTRWPEPSARGAKGMHAPRAALNAEQAAARDLALADARVRSLTEGRRAELMGVQAVGGQVTETSRGCLDRDCWMVQLYDLDRDATVQAIVDPESEAVLDVLLVPDARPGINARLADRAREIAFAAPEVADILGGRPDHSDWGPMDAGHNDLCPPDHYCVAPSFRVGDTIAWAFVDLTTEEFLGMAWTAPGPNTGASEPQRYVEAIEGCADPTTLQQGAWQLFYETTPTDGLRVAEVRYNGVTVMTSAKLVQWHADYGEWGYQDTTGCGGGGGGGYLIYPIGPAAVTPILGSGSQPIGFRLEQTFSMDDWGATCNYRYGQRYDFYNDGRFRVTAGAYGKGCESDTLYRALLRIDLAAGGSAISDRVERWNGSGWGTVMTESRFGPGEMVVNPSNHAWRVMDAVTGTGFAIEPGRSQFGDGGQGDNPFLYVLRHHPNEGDTDLGAIGDCCDDENPGLEAYLNGEPVANENVVLWYLPQMLADGVAPGYYCWTVNGNPSPETYPCWGGPMFHPVALGTNSGYLPLIAR